MFSDVGILRFVFFCPADRGMRRFLLEQCEMEIDEYVKIGSCCYTSLYCDCEGSASAVSEARFTLIVARCLPFLGFRVLGLKKLWLELMGCRIARVSRFPMSGLDTLRTVASQDLNLDPAKAGRMTIDDLYRAFCSAPLIDHWQHDRKKFLEDCARYGKPRSLRAFAR